MCPDREILSSYLDGEVEEPWKARIAEHLESCAECRGAYGNLERLDGVLRADPSPDFRESQVRVRSAVARPSPAGSYRVSLWRRRVAVPLPALGVAAVLLFMMGLSTLMLTIRADHRSMSISTRPSGITEVKITAPIQELEHLLMSLDRNASKQELVIRLPDEPKFFIVGEPAIVREAEYFKGQP
jgi:hypothetical protein